MEQYLRDTLEGLDRTTEEALLRPEEQSALNNTTREPAVLRALETYMLLDHLRPRLSCEQISEIRGAVVRKPANGATHPIYITLGIVLRMRAVLQAHVSANVDLRRKWGIKACSPAMWVALASDVPSRAIASATAAF